MGFYKTKPATIEAIQFTGTNGAEVRDWVNSRADFGSAKHLDDGYSPKDVHYTWFITKSMTASTGGQAWRYVKHTNGGAEWPDSVKAAVYVHLSGAWVPVHDGEWVIKGGEGEFYPCAPEVFAAKYEEA